MASPNATILLSVNGGGFIQTSTAVPQGQTVASAATIQLKGSDITGWQQASWEIFAFPPNWGGPSGGDWSFDSTRNLYVSHLFQPSLITLPATNSLWGKWITRLVVNNGIGPGASGIQYSDTGQPLPSTMLDISGAWQTLSPNQGFSDIGLFEGAQFGGFRQWVLSLQNMLRTLDGGAFAPTGAGTITWQRNSGAAPSITIPASAIPQGAAYRLVSSAGTCVLPTSPTAGQQVFVLDEDGTAVSFGITLQGGSNSIIGPGTTTATTFMFSTAANGYAAGSNLMVEWITGLGKWKVM